MHIFLRKFKLFLLNGNYSSGSIKRSLRNASIFLCWYHGDLGALNKQHYENFVKVLNRKNYAEQEIQEYLSSLTILYGLLHKKISIEQQKKPHHKDEVLSNSR